MKLINTLKRKISFKSKYPPKCKDKFAIGLLKQLFWMLEIDVDKLAEKYNLELSYQIYKHGLIYISTVFKLESELNEEELKMLDNEELQEKFNPFKHDIVMISYQDVLYHLMNYQELLQEIEKNLQVANSDREILRCKPYKTYYPYEHFLENFTRDGKINNPH